MPLEFDNLRTRFAEVEDYLMFTFLQWNMPSPFL
jgi:hypothetical protein